MAAATAAVPAAGAVEGDSSQVARIYEAWEKLHAAGDNQQEGAKWYLVLLESVKGDQKAKQLVSQFIPQFFRHFPNLAVQALNAQLDLCEDDAAQVRMYAIPGLTQICKSTPEHVQHIGTVLGQLLIAEQANDKVLAVVKKAFAELFDIDTKQAFTALLAQINSDNGPLRAKLLEVLKEQMNRLRGKIAKDDELQKSLAEGLKKALAGEASTGGQDFKTFLDTLRRLKVFKTDPTLAQDISGIIASHAGLNRAFEPANGEAIQALVTNMHVARTMFNKQGDNAQYLSHFFAVVAPAFEQIDEKNRLVLLKGVCGITHTTSPETARIVLPNLVKIVRFLIPASAGESVASSLPTSTSTDEKNDSAPASAPKINFSAVECALFLLHQLGGLVPDAVKEECGIFVPTGQPSDFRPGLQAKREEFQNRLKGVSAASRAYAAQVRQVSTKLAAKIRQTQDAEEKKQHAEKQKAVVLALRTAQNIEKMAAALTQTAPHFYTGRSIGLSFQGRASNADGGEEKKGGQQGGNKKKGQQQKGKGGAQQQQSGRKRNGGQQNSGEDGGRARKRNRSNGGNRSASQSAGGRGGQQNQGARRGGRGGRRGRGRGRRGNQ